MLKFCKFHTFSNCVESFKLWCRSIFAPSLVKIVIFSSILLGTKILVHLFDSNFVQVYFANVCGNERLKKPSKSKRNRW